jgi:HEAT repeat protein
VDFYQAIGEGFDVNANLCNTSATILLAALIANIPFCLPAAQPPEVTDRDLRARLDHAVQESYDPKSHPNTVNAAASASAGIGLTNHFVSYLLNRLQQQEVSGESRYQLAAAVARLGPAAAAAAPILSRWLRDPNTIVQYHAFVALGQVNPQSPISFEALERIQRLGSVDPEVQYATLLAMQQQAAPRAAEIPIVITVVKETDHRGLKCFALETLGLIGPAHTGALRAILACVAESDEFISETGLRALRRIDTAHVELVPVLAEALSSSSWKARYYAAEALREFGPRAKPAVPALAAALSRADSTDKHYWVGAYLEALRAVGPGAVEAADPIVRLLAERSALYRNRSKYEVEQLRAFMLVTLSEVGIPDAALPFILDALANSDTLSDTHSNPLRIYAAGAIAAGALGARAADGAPFLLRALRPEFRDYPLTFESYLGNIPKSGIYTSPRIEAIRALGKIGPAAKTATSLLTELAQREGSPQLFSQMPLTSDEARTALALIGGQ